MKKSDPLQHPFKRPPLKPVWRQLLHLFLLCGGWALYVIFMIQSLYHPGFAIRPLLWVIGLSVTILPLITTLWISYNLRLYKKKGPRKHSVEVPETYTEDYMGRKIKADWEKLQHKKIIFIEIEKNQKIYK